MQKHQDNINLFRSIFKGRVDVFAVRWEKPAHPSGGGNKSGYMPAVFYDPYRLRVHKMNGGTSYLASMPNDRCGVLKVVCRFGDPIRNPPIR